MVIPAIVVITYNRPYSLSRLLNSLNSAEYENNRVSIIISIDYQNSELHSEVVKIANDFDWRFGNKIVIEHKQNLGLRKHVISCGNLTSDHDSIIMLEDDLVVSPFFYSFASQALAFYSNDERIGGISLYNHRKNFNNGLYIDLLGEYDSDIYFLQIASSWGQAWTKEQWENFRNWYDSSPVISKNDKLPKSIINWPESSWLKYFIKFLVDSNRYFVYPKISFSTNFGDSGTHNVRSNSNYQVPLCIKLDSNFLFIDIEKSVNVYDSYFELTANIISRLNSSLVLDDCVIDLYGLKNLTLFSEKYALSSKKLTADDDSITSFGLSLKPMTLNIISNIEGINIHYANSHSFINDDTGIKVNFTNYDYFFGAIHYKVLSDILLGTLRNKIIDKKKKIVKSVFNILKT